MGKYGWTNNSLTANNVSINKLVCDASIISGNGAIPVNDFATGLITSGAASAVTLADGYEGQFKLVVMKTRDGSHNAVVTPTNLTGGSTITFSLAGQYVLLQFTGGSWLALGGNVAIA
jgi:hypothetical protein